MESLSFARFGRYLVLDTLGRGGTGRVDLALTLDAGGCERLVVLKRLRTERDDQDELLRMLLKEARLAARFAHPNIVSVFDVEVEGGEIAMVMEHLEGHSLADLFEEHRAEGTHVPLRVALGVMRGALLGLHRAHEMTDYSGAPLNVVHRDFTPHNVFVTRDGHAKVLDFGIAKSADAITRTGTGLIKGKLGYMAPEQIMAQPMDRRVDVFAAGVILWELLTGKRIGRSSFVSEVVRTATEPVPPIRYAAEWVDEELAAIVTRAVEVDPNDRYPTAAALREALDTYAAAHEAFGSPLEVAGHLEDVLGAVRRSRETRLHSMYPSAVLALRRDDPHPSDYPTARFPIPTPLPLPSDAPAVKEVVRSMLPTLPAKLRRAPRGVAAGAALVAVSAFALGQASFCPVGTRVANAANAATREVEPRHVTEQRESLLLPHGALEIEQATSPETARLGYVSLNTNPASKVTIDGHRAGMTPIAPQALEPGAHSIRTETKSGLVREHIVDVAAGERTALVWALE